MKTSPSGTNDPLRAAAKRAISTAPDTALTSIEAEEDQSQWEVKLARADGTTLVVTTSQDGQKVLAGPTEEQKSASDKAEIRGEVTAAKLDYTDAIGALETAVPNGRIDELELDTAGGTVVWEADVYDDSGAKRSFDVDATTGEVRPG